jgi:predicted metalloprotease with PDZ domain
LKRRTVASISSRTITPLFPQCNPKGRAAAAGLGPGDTILSICGTNITQMNSMQIKQELLRAGNELDLIVRK